MSLPLLAHTAEVFRLVSHTDEHFPPGAEKPHPVAFRLTSEDVEDGRRRALPPSLSTFDVAKTTTTQGREIRRAQAAAVDRTPTDTTPFALKVADIRAIVVPKDFDQLDVVADPLVPSWGPGSDGHTGVTGLDGKAGTHDLKNKLKLLRFSLREICYRINET